MAVPDAKEKWSGRVNEMTIGATPDQGGTRGRTVTVGGASGIPFLDFDGQMPHPPAIAVDVFDRPPIHWPPPLAEAYRDVWEDPVAWAQRAKDLGADLINLRLISTHPDEQDRSPEQAVETVRAVLQAVDLPLIIWGCGVAEKDQRVMPRVAEAAQGENCLLGAATETDYRTLCAAAQAYGHKLITLAPCDINKQKQVNILASDMGFPLTDIVNYPTTASLGYGMEYIYSILERIRLAALSGDKLVAQPVLVDPGYEAWRAKEAKAGSEMAAQWGELAVRGPAWEAATACNLLQGGADILVLCHPVAIAAVREAIRLLVST